MANELTKIPKFRRCVLQNFPFIEQDFDALTDYQLLCKVVEYLNKVITSQNEVIDVAESLTVAFNQLQSFVEDYFENLDVQEEINNKLDEMAEAGTLQEIIATYLDSNVAWTFNTVADMKNATNLKDGSFARTLGFHSINDGGGATYYITDTGTADEMQVIAIGDLYANLVLPTVLAPEQVGCYGDGTTNDTTAFAKACNLSKFVIGKGKYLIKSITLEDVDIKADIKARETGGITFGDNVYYHDSKFTHAVGGTVDDGARCIYVTGSNDVIDNVTFDVDLFTGLAVAIYDTAVETKVLNCKFKPDFKIDIWASGSDTIIDNCMFDEHTANTTSPISHYGNGIKVSKYLGVGEANKNNIKITNNTILAHGDNPIDCYTGATNVIIDGNYIVSNNTLNIEIKADGENQGENNREYVISNNIMSGARNIRITNNNNANLTNFIIEGNQFYTNAGSCVILEQAFDAVVSNCQFRSANQTSLTAINFTGTSTEIIRKLVLDNCTFDNFYSVFSEGAGSNYSDIYLNNIVSKNTARFARVRSNATYHLNNCDIATSSNTFNNIENAIYITNTKITAPIIFSVVSSDAIISCINDVFNAANSVFARGSSSTLYKYLLIGCDHSTSPTLGSGVADTIAFSTAS